MYEDTRGLWLRWYDDQNHWISTEAERVQQAEKLAQQEHQRATLAETQLVKKDQEIVQAQEQIAEKDQEIVQAQEQYQKLLDHLRAKGIDLDQL
jgi:uncharacterized protein (DUF3084 family)